MTKIKILCKNCGTEMEVDDLLREQIESSLHEKISSETSLKLREKEKLIVDLKTKLDEALRRAELGSQQLQGAVQEEEIFEILRELYPFDEITRSKRGVNAADILQTVNLQDGTMAGRIYYESKRTKSWSSDWISKLKQDNLNINADICVLVSSALPKEINRFGIIDGVFVIGFSDIKEASLILRHSLLKVHAISITQNGKKSKMELLYEYLTSNRFKDTFQTIIDGYHSLQKSHQNEKSKILKMWSERERMLNQVLFNSIEFYENIVGITGTAIPTVPSLESPKVQD
jgi:hypothetical protein